MIKELLIKIGVDVTGAKKPINDLDNSLENVKDNTGKATENVKQFTDKAGELPGVFGRAVGSAKEFGSSIKNIVASNPLLAALAGTVALILAVFTKLDPIVDKFGQIMAGLGAAFGNFVESAGKLLQGDWEGFADGVSRTMDAYSEGSEAARALQDLDDAQSAVALSAAKYNYQIDILIKQARNANLTEKERQALLERARRLQEEDIEMQKKVFQERLRALSLELHAIGVTYAQMIEAAKGRNVAELGIQNTTAIEKLKALQQFGVDYINLQRENEVKREKIQNAYDQTTAKKAKQKDDKFLKLQQDKTDQYNLSLKKMQEMDAEDERLKDEAMYARLTKEDQADQEQIYKKRDYTETKKKLINEETLAYADMTSGMISAFANLNDALGGNAQTTKALGIASAVIDTFVGANKALAQGGALGVLAASAIVANGLANVARIKAVKIPGKSDLSSPSFGGSVGRAAPPLLARQSSFVKLDNENPVFTKDLSRNRVYVLESDITDTQQKVSAIRNRATIK